MRPKNVISAKVAAAFLRWFHEYVGTESFDEMTHPALDEMRQALRSHPCLIHLGGGRCTLPIGHQGAHQVLRHKLVCATYADHKAPCDCGGHF